MHRKTALAGVSVALLAFAVPPALAGRGGSKGNDPAPASCRVDGNMVEASGLPTGQVINFMITDASGSDGWVLGYTTDGTWNVMVTAATSPTTYQFISQTWGPNGSKYSVFATC